jgi:hypothetical protein
MIKLIRIVVIVLVAFSLCFAKSKRRAAVPTWIQSQEKIYPKNRFLVGRGEDVSQESARQKAVTAISMYFSTSVDARNKLIEVHNESIQNNNRLTRSFSLLSSNITISSQTEFMGVKFADDYKDRKGSWYSLAYINKQDVSKMYENRISDNNTFANELLTVAEKERNPLSVFAIVEEARTLLLLNKEYASMLSVINQNSTSRVVANLAQIERRINEININSRQRLMTASIVCADKEHDRVAQKLQEILMKSGWNSDSQEPNFDINVSVRMNLEEGQRYWFVRPMIDVRVLQLHDGRTIFSYSKTLERAGHLSKEGARNRAYLDIEKDLMDNFMNQFIETFGN